MANGLPRWLACRLDPIELLLRIVLGGFFIYAALPKLADPLSFSDQVRNYRIIDDPWVALVAMGLPVLELLAGACVVLRVFYPGALVAIAAMLCGFIPALASLLVRGIEGECGCLSAGFTPDIQILIDIALLAMALVLLWILRRKIAADA